MYSYVASNHRHDASALAAMTHVYKCRDVYKHSQDAAAGVMT
jgi:hypothetical protein